MIFAVLFSSCSEFKAVFNRGPQTSPVARSVKEKSSDDAIAQQQPKQIKTKQVASNVSHDSLEDLNLIIKSPEDRDAIKTKRGIYYFVKPGDTLNKIALNYNMRADHIIKINHLQNTVLPVGRRLYLPRRSDWKNYLTKEDLKPIRKATDPKSVAANNQVAKKTADNKAPQFKWPLKKFVLTSKHGQRRGRPHQGVDLSAQPGTPIFAAASGKVIYAKRFAGYGNLIVIKHNERFFSAYAHAQQILTTQGREVKTGQKIATVGRTGRASGNHLHFEIRDREVSLDPLKFMPKSR